MPQIDQILTTYASQIFWMLLVFGLIYFGIGRAMLPKVEATVDQRNSRIAGDLAAAEAARGVADTLEEEQRLRLEANRAEAAKLTQAAKDASARETEAKVKAHDAELDVKLNAAEARLAGARDAALGEIETVAADAAREMVARLSGAQVQEVDAQAAVKRVLAHG